VQRCEEILLLQEMGDASADKEAVRGQLFRSWGETNAGVEMKKKGGGKGGRDRKIILT